MGKGKRHKQPPRRDKYGDVSRGMKRSAQGKSSNRRKKGMPACPVCGGTLYSAEGFFYCGGCGWDNLPETPPIEEAE